ncbi:MAG: diadenylate cyclase [Byssovorax sp.]
MPEGLLRLFAARPLSQIARDLVDILIVAWVIYRALLVLRGTRAIQMAVGLGIALLVYLGARTFHFVTLQNLLSWLLSSIVLIVVVVFQNDIRRALIRMGGTAWFTGGREQQSRVIDEVVAAATELARHRMGALIAFEQDANVLEFVKSEGIQLDCVVTRELLVSLFVPESVNKLHDGAVLIRDLKIARAGVFFPMPDTKILDAQLGSRHRAALGITEETDAVVVVVSEERGTISFCFSGNIVSNLDGQSLRHALLGLFGRSAKKKRGASKKAAAPVSAGTPAPVSVAQTRGSTPDALAKSGAITVKTPPPSVARPSTATPPATTTLMRASPASAESLAARQASGPMPAGKPAAPAQPTSTPMRPSMPPEPPRGADAAPTSIRASSFVPMTTKRADDEESPSSRRPPRLTGASATASPIPAALPAIPLPPAALPLAALPPAIVEKEIPSDPPPSGPIQAESDGDDQDAPIVSPRSSNASSPPPSLPPAALPAEPSGDHR